MPIFSDIELDWKGATYSIKGDGEVMRALAVVEEHITYMEVENARRMDRPPLAKISNAYAALLRFAGCRVSGAEVYAGMWEDGVTVQRIAEACVGLLQLMIPPTAIEASKKKLAARKTPVKKRTAKKAVAKSSRSRTKRP